ncbi:MAG: hypothetical protein J2P57_18620 [Acidimicrobiaceae bacterium]|nr:hypothetical protein [Acidimicrobiaceae bacterium]
MNRGAVNRWVLLATAVPLALTACSAAGAHRPPASRAAAATLPPRSTVASTTTTSPSTTLAPTTTSSSTTSTTVPRPAPTAPPPTLPPEQPGWLIAAATPSAILVDRRTIALPDGAIVTVARFRAGYTRVALHVGSEDPPTGGVPISAAAGSVVTTAQRALLVGAFNGGFKADTGAGGFDVLGTTLVPLRAGYESLVIDTNGTPHVGIWQQGLPVAGERVASVRQNLGPLVANGVPSSTAGDVAAWGATLGGVADVARSALGEDARGDLLFAGSMHALPSDLASALVDAGAANAMELDINPEWVQLDLAGRPGGPLVAAIPGQARAADQYLLGWTRDFVTVTSAG